MTETARSHSTKQRILDAAEALTGERGYDGTSLRAITGAARANLAAVHYHFSSKESLIQAVYSRRLGPINRERLALLDAAEAAAGRGAPSLESVVRALIEPALRLGRENPVHERAICRLMGRLFSEPALNVDKILGDEIRTIIRRFMAALQRALPRFSPEELFWRFNFIIGAMAHTLAAGPLVETLSGGRHRRADADASIERLTAFSVAGLTAAPTHPSRAGKRKR